MADRVENRAKICSTKNVREFALKWFPILLLAVVVHADSPPPPPSVYEVWSQNKKFCAVLDPVTDKTTVFKVEGDRSKIWSMPGWFTGVDLANDGEHLIIGPSNLIPLNYSKNDLMIRFVRKGSVVKDVYLKDLISDFSKLSRTVSHFHWGDSLGLDASDAYGVKTIEGKRFKFDITNGNLIKTESALPNTPEAREEYLAEAKLRKEREVSEIVGAFRINIQGIGVQLKKLDEKKRRGNGMIVNIAAELSGRWNDYCIFWLSEADDEAEIDYSDLEKGNLKIVHFLGESDEAWLEELIRWNEKRFERCYRALIQGEPYNEKKVTSMIERLNRLVTNKGDPEVRERELSKLTDQLFFVGVSAPQEVLNKMKALKGFDGPWAEILTDLRERLELLTRTGHWIPIRNDYS
jgi:hypothetical protein